MWARCNEALIDPTRCAPRVMFEERLADKSMASPRKFHSIVHGSMGPVNKGERMVFCPTTRIHMLADIHTLLDPHLHRLFPQETTHRYGPNSFKLHRLPTPRPGQVLGLVGTNGIGKSTALKVLSGKLKPNLGRFEVRDITSYSGHI